MVEPPRTEAAAAPPAPSLMGRVLAWRPSGWSRTKIALLAGLVTLAVLTAVGGAWWWHLGSPAARAPKRTASLPAGADASSAPTGPQAVAAQQAAATPSAPGSAVIGPIVASIRPRLAEAASSSATTHFALVGPPLQDRAAAEALLRRLQAETTRIRHPTATETSIDETPQGWRVSWWPFTSRRQADNARTAMVAHRITLEVVDF